ncbi:MAG: hypothetical protein M3Q95_06060 [Bacteroidota bacterium]|nr:hypothetical protein [Bacteroidota bacterium]
MKTQPKLILSVFLMACPILSFSQSQCNIPVAQADLDINNVRTTILVGGDMWWDVSNPKYEVPKGSGKHSLYAGALWIGGFDAGGQMRLAGQTYRQSGADFWGGPLDTVSTSITQQKCNEYDRHWKISKEEVQNFINNPSSATNTIKSWPGNGDPLSNEGTYLAPFVDVNADGIYNYEDGDYPGYNFSGDYTSVPGVNKTVCNDYLFGDQSIWWVFNDVGNIHTATGSEPIGLEIRAQAFSFQTNDEINNMTFYKYQIINRSSTSLTETYFGQWVDPDLGFSTDDYVGCDVGRGLGFCYNGDADDETASGYGLNPPAVGVDFFQGPVADSNDGIDNDKDGCTDCTFLEDSLGNVLIVDNNILGEQIIMSKFVYYDNVNDIPTGNPETAADFYNYLRGVWLDGQPMTFGGDGRDPSAPITDYMFPGNSDPEFPTQDWSEVSENNPVGDRRFIQSAGTFTLLPGAVNYITTGVVWARAAQGGQFASVDLVKLADDKAQALFDNCFKLIDGPDAPEVSIRELNRSIVLTLHNTNSEKVELYHEKDPTISGWDDSLTYFDFQGYQIYQLADANASVGNIGDENRIRLLAQCDIKDGVTQLVNYEFDPALNASIPIEKVNGNNAGITHSFEIKQDLFATGNTALINHKTYFYTVISYAHNNYKSFNPNDGSTFDGQKKPYLAGRNNVRTYSAIPHHFAPENNGQQLNSQFGAGPVLKRIEGQGNGGMVLDFTPATVDEILTPPLYRSFKPSYLPLKAPVLVKVFDPVLVQGSRYRIQFEGTDSDDHYNTTELLSGITIPSDYPYYKPNEQVYSEWGLTARAHTVTEPGDSLDVTNGFLEGTMEFANPGQKWLTAVRDVDDLNRPAENWIRSGSIPNNDYTGLDKFEVYENVINGTWAPFKLAAKEPYGPKWGSIGEIQISLSPNNYTNTAIAGVDIVLTSDQSKWTRCAVIETGSNFSNTIGNARQYELRKSPSIGKNGESDLSVGATGMSWFPGYAYNLETGERLNIAFGENSVLTDDRSQDMKFNPTHRTYDANGDPVLGGMHFIYIFGHNGDAATDVPMYDSCRYVYTKLFSGNSTDKRSVWKNGMWCNIPLVAADYKNINLPTEIPSDVKVRLRVSRQFRPYAALAVLTNTEDLNQGTTYYVASTPVIHNGITYTEAGTAFIANNTVFTGAGSVTTEVPLNNFNPLYEFGTYELAAEQNSFTLAKDALNMVNVVPNPYYAYSSYEVNQLDNRIKIVNLPPQCTVSIYTQSGTLVRKIKRDVPSDNSEGIIVNQSNTNNETSVDWDLKNQNGIPIASGVYLIHVDAGSLGQTTLKWFGMIRPIDLDTF